MIATALFWRAAYHVRISGNGIDTKRKIPATIFGSVRNDHKSKAADRIARKYADNFEEVMRSEPKASTKRDGAIGVAQRDCTSRMPLAQVGQLFIARNAGTLNPKTIVRYGQIIRQLVDFFGNEWPDQIHVGRLEQFRDKRLTDQWTPRLGTVPRRQISPRTVHGELVFAVKLLGFGFDRAIETGMTSLPVRKAPDVVDRCRTRGRALTMEEFWRAYDAAGTLPRAADRYQRMLVLGLTTMLRDDPLLNLSYEWMDLTERTVTIPPQFVKKGRGRVRKELTLPLCAWSVDVIRRVGAVGSQTRCDAGPLVSANTSPNERGAVFTPPLAEVKANCGPTTSSIDSSTGCVWGAPIANVQPTLVRIAHIAGIRPFSLHDLRRTGATLLLNHRCDHHPQGVPKFTVDRLLGHAMPLLDEAYYSLGIDALRDAVSVFDEEWDKRRGVDGVDVVAIGRSG